MKYDMLFPFERIRKDAKIILYGAGIIGRDYLRQISLTRYVSLICILDRAYKDYQDKFVVPVYPPEQITNLDEYDAIVLALRDVHVREVINVLLKYGVPPHKIIYVDRRKQNNTFVLDEGVRNNSFTNFFREEDVSFAIKLNASLGDNIVRKKVVESIIQLVPTCTIDLYSRASRSFLPALYFGCKNIRNFVYDRGFLFEENMSNYKLALTISHFIEINRLSISDMEEEYPDFCKKMCQLKEKSDVYEFDEEHPIYTHIARNIKQGHKYYSSYRYDDVFDISNDDVEIILNPRFSKLFVDLQLTKYITIHYGNGVEYRREDQVPKEWPKEHFEELVYLLKIRYPGVFITQLGGDSDKKLDGVDRYYLGEDMELVKYILKNSIVHIDIEGGLVHLATQLGTKCVVLFGPTQVDFYGYSRNINVQSERCNGCYGMYVDMNKCARGLTKPECMRSIQPQMVMDRIEKYLGRMLRTV